MLKLGLTGGIGAGKSTVARRLGVLGAVVIDADQLAREVVRPGSAGLAAVVQAFGPSVLAADGSLDRPALGALVFVDEQARLRLNGILHPRIAGLTAQRLAALPDEAIAVHDVPLLVENRMDASYHLVLVVHASVDERVRRLVRDRDMAEADARARVGAQADEAARLAAADVWIENSGPVDDVLAQVDRLWEDRIVPFALNLRRHQAPPFPAGSALVSPDRAWAGQGRRLGRRIARAAGELAVRVDHVGSTAVPGLPARNVIDLQLVVPDPSAVVGVREALEAAGFVRAGDGDAVHASADPARPARLMAVPVEEPTWGDALLIRDWLRAHGGEREAYEAVRRGPQAFDAEEGPMGWSAWTVAALERARAWRRASGWNPDQGEA